MILRLAVATPQTSPIPPLSRNRQGATRTASQPPRKQTARAPAALPGRPHTYATNAIQIAQDGFTSGTLFNEVDSMQGRVLAGRYQLISKLGQGSMGTVWRAEHLTLRTQVAVKLIDPINPELAQSDEALARFRQEALAAAELRSTHIVQIIDYGIDEGTPYIAMELLEGQNLADRLEAVGRLSLAETAQILAQAARALDLAHSKGIVHRDLKPDNIFIAREGSEELIKVLDFGVAKMLNTRFSGVSTNAGAMIGTPYYMSPEQALGEAGIDHRSDIWALGVIAFECMTGRRPFEQDTLGTLLIAICQEPPPKPSQRGLVPRGVDEWFARATARTKSARFHSAGDAAAALSAIANGTSQQSIPNLAATVPGSPNALLEAGSKPADLNESVQASARTTGGQASARPASWLAVVALLGVGLSGVLGFILWRTEATGAAMASGAQGTSLPQNPVEGREARPPLPPRASELPPVEHFVAAQGPSPSAAPSSLQKVPRRLDGNAPRPALGPNAKPRSGTGPYVQDSTVLAPAGGAVPPRATGGRGEKTGAGQQRPSSTNSPPPTARDEENFAGF